jgi:hypothetical protein
LIDMTKKIVKLKELYIATNFADGRWKHSKTPKIEVYRGSGILYLTSGGRVVQDCGWGEYFSQPYDKPIFTLDELRRGTTLKEFLKKIVEIQKDRKKAKFLKGE